MHENRKFTRVPFVHVTAVLCDDACTPAETVNLSLKGILLKTLDGSTVPLGETRQIALTLAPSDIVLSFLGVMVHENEGLLGFRFIETDIDSITHLRALLEQNMGDEFEITRELSFLIEDDNPGV